MSRFGDDCRGLDAAYDSISFDPATCILTASGVGVDHVVADLSAIIDKVEFPEEVVTRIETRPGGLFYVNEEGEAFEIPTDTVTEFVLNADGSHTYTNEAGHEYTIPAPTEATPPSTFSYDKDMHAVTHNGVTHMLNKVYARYDNVNCAYVIEDEAGGEISLPVRKSQITVQPNPDGSQTITHFDGCGKVVNFRTQPVVLDTKGDVNIDGTLITIEGDNKTIQFDICAMVAANCNSTFTELTSDGSWKHKDNAGNLHEFTMPAFVKDVCYVGADGVAVQGDLGDDGKVYLPYAQICMKAETQDGDFLDVIFDPDTGCYVIPFTESEDTNSFGTVDATTDPDNFIFSFPDGTEAHVTKRQVRDVVSGDGSVDVTVNAGGQYDLSVAHPTVTIPPSTPPTKVCLEDPANAGEYAMQSTPSDHEIKERYYIAGKLSGTGSTDPVNLTDITVVENEEYSITGKAEHTIRNNTCSEVRVVMRFGSSINAIVNSATQYRFYNRFSLNGSLRLGGMQTVRPMDAPAGETLNPEFLSRNTDTTYTAVIQPGQSLDLAVWMTVKRTGPGGGGDRIWASGVSMFFEGHIDSETFAYVVATL